MKFSGTNDIYLFASHGHSDNINEAYINYFSENGYYVEEHIFYGCWLTKFYKSKSKKNR